MDELPEFDDTVDMLRDRLERRDALDLSGIHSFKTTIADQADILPDSWYWQAFEELESLGHLDPVSHKVSGGDACARLNAEGRTYARYVRRSREKEE